MITIEVTRKGSVELRPVNKGDRQALRKLDYVLRRRGRWITFWPYLVDLRRDLPRSQLQFHPSTAARLIKLKREVDALRKGDNDRILPHFKEGMKPYNFQLEAIHAGLNGKRILIADDTGLGKTVETLGIMLTALAEKEIRQAVLVVPAGLKHQWAEQIDEFAEVPPEPVLIAGGSPAKRRALYKRPWRVLVINPELVRIDARHLERIAKNVGLVALDEAACIKNEDSKIAQCMKRLWVPATYRIALTATPVENHLDDLWSLIRWIDPKAFISRKYFDRRYIVWRKRKFSVRKKSGKEVKVTKHVPLRYTNLREVESKIRHCYIRRRVADVGMELPELIVSWDRMDLPKRQRDTYDAIKQRLEKRIKETMRGAALYAPLQTLRQACNSTALVEKDRGQKHAHVKVDRLRQLMTTEFSGEQVIVFTDYERFARLLKTHLRDFKPVTYTGKMTKRDRQRSIDSFKAGDKRLLIGTKALERGHNMQNASIVVNIDLPFNPAAVKQRIGRVRRLKSKHGTVRLWNMIANGTVEEFLILRSIYSKRKLFEGIFESDELTDADPLEQLRGDAVWDML